MINRLPRPDVIITHESDLDGLMAGVLLRRLARKLFDADVRLEACHYNVWRQRELRERSAWVADMGFEARLDKPNWVIIDHHATELSPRNATLIHDLGKSAALLSYELCRELGLGSPVLDRLVHLSNVADLFLEEDPDFMLASDYANLVKIYQFWNLHNLLDGRVENLLDHPLLEVMAVKRRIEDPIGLAWSGQNIVPLSPTVGFVNTVIGNTNLIVHQLLEQQAAVYPPPAPDPDAAQQIQERPSPAYPVLLTLFRRANGLMIASLRSRNGQAIKVAEILQGGGHANASAATLPRSVKSIPDALNYLRQVLNPAKQELAKPQGLSDIFDAPRP